MLSPRKTRFKQWSRMLPLSRMTFPSQLRGLIQVLVVSILHELLMRHLLPPIRLLKRHQIMWPISINEWTHRIFNSVRSKDNSIISSHGSIHRAPWAPTFRHLLLMLRFYVFWIIELPKPPCIGMILDFGMISIKTGIITWKLQWNHDRKRK